MNLSRYQSTIIRFTEDARRQLIGCQVRLNTSRAKKWNGRLGSIQGVIPDADHGLLVLVMVFYDGQTVGGSGSLNHIEFTSNE